ncbi:MAG: helix-turn-helix domain-containing protein [Pseudomonadota bacterium]
MFGLSLNAISVLAISQLAFISLFFFAYHRRHVIGQLLTLYSFCLICHVLSNLPDTHLNFPLQYFFYRMATLVPAVLWLLSRFLFVDNARVPAVAWILMAVYMALRAYGSFASSATPSANVEYFIYYVIPQVIMLGFSVHAVYMAFQGLSYDLVESRRRLRVTCTVAMGIFVAAVLINGFIRAAIYYASLYSIELTPIPNEWLFFYLFLITLAFNLTVMRLHGEAQQVIVLPQEQGAPLSAVPHLTPVPSTERRVDNPALVERIFEVLKKERLYSRPGLTIGELAERLSLQEYRLRRVINKQLGYRNFNQFLNAFRIEEACNRLALPFEQREPIANIAFDVGYSALSSFNKAFKDMHNLTPTQYRASVQGAAPVGAGLARD